MLNIFRGDSSRRSSAAHDRGRPGVTGSPHHRLSRQQPYDDHTYSHRKGCPRLHSTSPPVSTLGIAGKQRTESPNHGLMHAHVTGWVVGRVGRGSSDHESSSSDSGYSSNPAQLPCTWTSEPSSTTDSTRSTHAAQLSQMTRPSTCSSRDCDNSDTRCSSLHQVVDSEPQQPDRRSLLDGELAQIGPGLTIGTCSENQGGSSGHPIPYQDTNTNRSRFTTPVDHISKRIDAQASEPTSSSDRTDDSSDSTERESKSSQPQEINDDSNGCSDNEPGKLCTEVFGAAVGKEFHEEIKGIPCSVPREKVKKSTLGSRDLTPLDALHLDAEGVIPNTVASGDTGGGSSHSSSQFTAGRGGSSGGNSSSRQGGSKGIGSTNPDNNQSARDRSGPVTGTKGNRKGAPSEKLRALRCPFNAFFPEYYCATSEAEPAGKYARCVAGGFTLMRYLKDHVVRIHVSPKVVTVPRCGRCQTTFATKKLLEDHDENVDCRLQCAECNQEFNSKSDRNAHNDQQHPKSNPEEIVIYREQYDEINILMMQYSPTTGDKKGKQIKHDDNPELDEWVSRNKWVFMVGRKDEVHARQQLGQWYILFTQLFPESDIPTHPFYDFEVVAQRGDDVEKFLSIFRSMRFGRRRTHGPLPTDPYESDRVYDELIRQCFKVAANNGLLNEVKGILDKVSQEYLPKLFPSETADPAVDRAGIHEFQHHHFQSNVLQPQLQTAGSSQPSCNMDPSNEGSLQPYGPTLPTDTGNAVDFSRGTLPGNYTAPEEQYSQSYGPTATSESSDVSMSDDLDPLGGTTFQAPDAQTGGFQLPETQLSTNSYQNQIQPEQQQAQPPNNPY